jgi:murein DD-endopeptidase MepM/ murein hydrolase activator NlpD
MDPNTTPAAGTWVNAGAYVGDYANPTNGHSTGPHVHYEQRDNGVAVDPGDVNLIQGGTITSPYGDEGTAHPNGHNGIDAILPRTNGCTGGCK